MNESRRKYNARYKIQQIFRTLSGKNVPARRLRQTSNVDARDGTRTATTSKVERFVIIDNGFQSLTIITKRSILDVAAVLDPPLDAVKNQTLSVTGLKCMHGVIYTLKMN